MMKRSSFHAWAVKSGFLGCIIMAFGTSDLVAAECSWVVRPNEPIVGLGSDAATYEIKRSGLIDKDLLYGFTAVDPELVRQLVDNKIVDLRSHARPLKLLEQEKKALYQLSPDSTLPRIIYLAAANEPVEYFEAIDARITPKSVTRGASALTGPMPQRTIPGKEILSIEATRDRATQSTANSGFQLCAYQVSW